MKKLILTLAVVMLMSASAFAIPALQLYIDGATYDTSTETWVATGSSVDLYVVASIDLENVIVSAALFPDEYPMGTDPNGSVGITYNGAPASTNWVYGYSPFDTYLTKDGGDDLPGQLDLHHGRSCIERVRTFARSEPVFDGSDGLVIMATLIHLKDYREQKQTAHYDFSRLNKEELDGLQQG